MENYRIKIDFEGISQISILEGTEKLKLVEGCERMKYFLDEAQRKATGGTCYFEFQKGKFRNKFWLKDSLCLHADTFDSLMLYELFSNSIEGFCYYASNEVKTNY